MQQRSEFHVISNVAWADDAQLVKKEDEAIIIERTEEGLVFFWPLFPRRCHQDDELIGNQDLSDYLVDGAWLTEDPWMYFDRISDVLNLINRQHLPLNTFDLGWLHSIRDARAKSIVMLSLGP